MRKLQGLGDDELWARWQEDIGRIKHDTYELFSSRRTFRDVAEVFRLNAKLQATGGHLWDWMRVCYASYVVIRVRREADEQGNTVNLNQLLEEIEVRSDVVTRARYFAMLALPPGHHMLQPNEQYFTDVWAGPLTRPNPANPGQDYVDAPRVRDDRQRLQAAVKRVQEVGNKEVAHRTRVDVKDLTFPELDSAFDAIEETLKKYCTLLHGVTLMQAEPAPQFNTREVFTFSWLEPERP